MYCVFVFHTNLSIDELNIEKIIHNYGFLKRHKSQFEHKYQIQLLENFQLTTRPAVAVPTTKTFRQLQYYTLILLLFYCYQAITDVSRSKTFISAALNLLALIALQMWTTRTHNIMKL